MRIGNLHVYYLLDFSYGSLQNHVIVNHYSRNGGVTKDGLKVGNATRDNARVIRENARFFVDVGDEANKKKCGRYFSKMHDGISTILIYSQQGRRLDAVVRVVVPCQLRHLTCPAACQDLHPTCPPEQGRQVQWQ